MRTSYGPLSRLISAKVTLLMLLSFSIGIIFLEARLYSVGSTVFGLLSVAALFIGKFEFPQITLNHKLYYYEVALVTSSLIYFLLLDIH